VLAFLVGRREVRGRGIEIGEDGVLACVRRGLSVRQGNLEEGLADYPTGSFDYVILSQTLPFLDDPLMILDEMLRVGRRAIVSLPNWGYWRSRLSFLLRGRIPPAPDYPQPWHVAPRWQALTISDFTHLCRKQNIVIQQQHYLSSARRISLLPNLLAQTAVFVLAR
jgi:methionine biosynthesis protein MetW